MNKIKVKRPITIKTVVTESFKKQASEELNKEIQLIDGQLIQLELQNKQIQDQIDNFQGQYGDDGIKQIHQALAEITQKIQGISSLKHELVSQKDTIRHIALDNVIVTGSLENYVELGVGENLYDKFKNAEILIKDGIIQEIRC
jgi:hypothetical protein